MKANDWQMPIYESFFPVDDYLVKWAQDRFQEINQRIEGRIACTPMDAAILAQAVRNSGHGNWLEIGTFFGGTAILAALTKKAYALDGKVVCVDDLGAGLTTDFILENARRLHVDDQIEIHVSKSYPFPLKDTHFKSAFIDAGHSYEDCLRDWNSVKNITHKYAVIHDVDKGHPGVLKAVQEAAGEWKTVFFGYHTAILEKP